jgi:hypothetical protein
MCRLPEAVDGASHQDWIQVDGHIFVLNGKGVHQFLFFKIYEVSLYLENKSADPESILGSKERKVIVLTLMRDVSADQLRSALYDGFKDNCIQDCDRFQPHLDRIAAKIPDLKEGESLQFFFSPLQLQLKSSGRETQKIQDPEFGSKFLAIWLGQSPPSQSLKNSLLGI